MNTRTLATTNLKNVYISLIIFYHQLSSNLLQNVGAQVEMCNAAREVLNYSDDDSAPQNGFDDILDEVCEAGYESEDSEEEAWWAFSVGPETASGQLRQVRLALSMSA